MRNADIFCLLGLEPNRIFNFVHINIPDAFEVKFGCLSSGKILVTKINSRDDSEDTTQHDEDIVQSNWTISFEKIKSSHQHMVGRAAALGNVTKNNYVVGFEENLGIVTVCLEDGHLLTLLNVSIKTKKYIQKLVYLVIICQFFTLTGTRTRN